MCPRPPLQDGFLGVIIGGYGGLVGGLAGFGVGALAGNGFWGSIASGASAGFGGGFTGGALGFIANGGSVNDALMAGLAIGAFGGVMGGGLSALGSLGSKKILDNEEFGSTKPLKGAEAISESDDLIAQVLPKKGSPRFHDATSTEYQEFTDDWYYRSRPRGELGNGKSYELYKPGEWKPVPKKMAPSPMDGLSPEINRRGVPCLDCPAVIPTRRAAAYENILNI